jgi:hypothetical protein
MTIDVQEMKKIFDKLKNSKLLKMGIAMDSNAEAH